MNYKCWSKKVQSALLIGVLCVPSVGAEVNRDEGHISSLKEHKKEAGYLTLRHDKYYKYTAESYGIIHVWLFRSNYASIFG